MKKTSLKETLKEIAGFLLFGCVCIVEAVITNCKKSRTLSKKVVAVCIAAALIVAMVPVAVFAADGDYGIYIGGVQITESNKNDLVQAINNAANATVASGSATYDSDNNTIILENFHYTGTGYDYGWNNRAAIYGGQNRLNINVIGKNTITCAGDGSCYGIRSESEISIYGEDAEQDKLHVRSEYHCVLSAEAIYVEDIDLSLISENGRGIDMWGSNLLAQVSNSIVSIECSDDGIYMNEYDDNCTFVISDSIFTVNSDYESAIHCSNIQINSAAYVLAGDSESEATYANPISSQTYENSYTKIVSDNPKNLSVTREGITEYYSCLEDASWDVEPNDVIQVEHDYVEMSPEIYLGSWHSYTIDLNGHEIHFQEYYWEDFGAMYYELSGPISLSSEEPDYGILTLTDSVGDGAIHALIYADGGLRIDSGTYGGLIAPYDTVIKGGTFTGLPQAAINAMMQDPYMSMFANMIGTKSVLHSSFFELIDSEEEARVYMDSIFASGYMADKEYDVYVTQSGYYLVALPANTSVVEAYKVTLHYGVGDEESFFALADNFTSLEHRAIPGKIFIGWYDDAEFTTLHDFSTGLTNDITLYAKYADYEDDKKELKDAIDALAEDVAQLNGLVENGGTIAQINGKISAIESQIVSLDALKNKYAEADTALKQELAAADTVINNAITALTGRVENLESEIAAAKSKIDTNASKVAELTGDLAELNTSLTNLSNTLTNDYTTKAELTNAINSATTTVNATISALTTRVQKLEAAIAEVNGKIDNNTSDIGTLKSDVNALKTWKTEAQDVINALKTLTGTQGTDIANLKLAVQSLQAELAAANARIDDAEDRIAVLEGKVSALETAKQNLEAAVAALNAAITDKADTATLNQKVSELNAAIAVAETAAKAYADEKDTALKNQLTAAIATAKSEAITVAENLVNTAKAELQAAIDNKADTATVNAAIANLQNAITALQNAKDNYIAADAALKAELEDAIAKAKQEAIDAAKGYIPYIGTNGNWWIGDTDAGVDANGIKGDKGDKGDTGADGVGIAKIEKTATNGNVDTYTVTLTNGKTYTLTVTNGKDGADGKDGLTPFIGKNGNWWIGDTDTGVKAAADDTIPVGSGNVTEAEGVDTVTVVAIVIAGIALLGNVLLAVLVLKKKKSLV